jgi:trehalose synthase
MQPSVREGFGLVITEALWKGKPVIAGNAGGIPFQIRHGFNGYFYQSVRKAAEKVSYLLQNPKAAAKLGENGRKHVGEYFTLPDRIADCLMAIDMTMTSRSNGKRYSESITSFYPWFTQDIRR